MKAVLLFWNCQTKHNLAINIRWSKNNFQKCLRDEKAKDVEYKKKTGKDRPIKLLNVTTHDYCKPYLKPQLLWKDMKLDDKGFPIKEEVSK